MMEIVCWFTLDNIAYHRKNMLGSLLYIILHNAMFFSISDVTKPKTNERYDWEPNCPDCVEVRPTFINGEEEWGWVFYISNLYTIRNKNKCNQNIYIE